MLDVTALAARWSEDMLQLWELLGFEDDEEELEEEEQLLEEELSLLEKESESSLATFWAIWFLRVSDFEETIFIYTFLLVNGRFYLRER